MPDTKRGRRPSAISTSFRSSIPSPSPSPDPSSPGTDGLTRRLSWSAPHADASEHPVDHGQRRSMARPSRTRLTPDDGPMEEYDLGSREARGSPSPQPWDGRDAPRPFVHQANSSTSLNSHPFSGSHAINDEPDDIPFASPSKGYPALSRKRRVYEEPGIVSARRNLAASVTRSPTFRAVSNTLRKASVRVSSMMSPNDGRTRIPDGDGDEEERREGYEMDPFHSSPVRVESPRPDGLPPEASTAGPRGRTLCVFGPTSSVRRMCSALVNWPWTESAVLILIIIYAVILTIQSSEPLYTPRPGNGYFQSWEDWAILIIFVIFTFEMFARIITTGLIFDPESTVSAWLSGPNGLIPRTRTKVERAQTHLHRASITPAARAAWRSTSAGQAPERKPTALPEAPFQTAVQRQLSLSAAGRPYLRHSWHRVDLLSIACFWITFVLASLRQEATDTRHIYIFRALSILRAGRLLVITSGTATILDSLKRAAPLLITVGFFVIFASTLFSIIGIQSFRGSFRRTCILTDPNNASNVIDTGQHCGGHLDPVTLRELPYLLLNGQPFSQGAKGFVCPQNQVCATGQTNPEGNAMSFDNFFYALIQVVIVASINTWAPVMYSAMDTDYFASALYWIVGVIIINFWLINLVVAVVVNTFKGVRADTRKSAFGANDTANSTDPNWSATDKKKEEGRILQIYRKTEYFWVVLVLCSLVAQGFKTDESSASTLDLLKSIELAITFAFDFEIAFRIFAYFPAWRDFISGPRNNFDLFLAVTSSIIQIPAIAASSTYPWLTVFQLLRWYRFVLAFPRMKPLLLRLFGSIYGLLNMTIFLFTMNFLAALFALQLFRGDLGDQEFISFSQTYNAFLGMYQLFSSEDWSDIMYNTMRAEAPYKQRIIAAIFLSCWLIFSFFIVLQMFIAVINEIAEEQKRKRQAEEFIRRGAAQSGHISWIDRLNPYRLVKARQQALRPQPQSLVLPVEQKAAEETTPAQSRSAMDVSRARLSKLFGREEDDAGLRLRGRSLSARHQPAPGEDDYADHRGLTDLLPRAKAAEQDELAESKRKRREQQIDFIAAHPSFDRSLWVFKHTNIVRRFCQACFDSAYGDRIYGRPAHPILRIVAKMIILATILASIAVAAISTPIYRKWYYETNGYFRGSWYDIVEAGLSAVFIIEAIMKIVADGFIFAPNAYLLSVWNIFDFVILLALIVNIVGSLIVIGGVNRLTRALRSVRALRLITLFSRLRDTLHVVLFAGFINIVDALILMILYIIPFAVWGLNIFSGAFYQCTETSASGFSTCLGETSIAPLDDSLAFLAPRVWSNPGLIGGSTVYSFDSFRQSMLILFEIVSLEGWIDVMNSATSITGRNNQPQENAAQWNSIFFIVFNLFGGVIILTLFVSIIIENFSMRSGMLLLTMEQRQWVDLSKFIKAQTPSQLPKTPPTYGIRRWCYDRATDKHGWWARAFTVIYYLHILLLAFEDFNNTIFNDLQIDTIFLILTMIYAVDLLVRFFGLGLRSFWANGWNIFDLVVITGSFATTIPALQDALAGSPGSQVNVQLQKLFLVAIALKLVQRNSRLNQLFKTSVASLPAIGKLFLLWACLFAFYAIMFVEVFGLTKTGTASQTRFQNYHSFGNALIMLAFMSTGEGWNGYMHGFTLEAPRCTSSANFLNSDCGSPGWAYFLFISWNILSMYIFLNMFTGVVVESFAYVYQMPGGTSLDREQMRAFKRVWADTDTQRTGYITRKQLIPFLSRLSGVFEVRPYPANMSMRSILRSSIPDPVDNAAGRLLVARGTRYAVDVRRAQSLVRQADSAKVRDRRRMFARLYHEARISEEPRRGISFTSMLFMLAHYKLIDDEKALQLDDLLERRAKTERVTDMVNLDRVRSLLRTVYYRRRYLRMLEEKRQAMNEGNAIPAIVLEPSAPSPEDEDGMDPFDHQKYSLPESPTSSHGSRRSSPGLGHLPHLNTNIPRHPSPSLSAGSAVLSRRGSDVSMLSHDQSGRPSPSLSDDRSRGNSPVFEEGSVWGDVMREAEERGEHDNNDNDFTHAR